MSLTAATASLAVRPSPVGLIPRRDDPRVASRRELVRVTRGVYALAREWRELAPWERYLARVHGVALRYPDAVFSHESACALLGCTVIGEPADVHVTAPASKSSRRRSGVRTHTTHELRLMDAGGILLTAPADTAVDLARSRHNAIGLMVVNSVLRRHPELTTDTLRDINDGLGSSRGRSIARWVLDRATGVTESSLEDLSLAVIEWLGFPLPELQHWFRGSTPRDDLRSDFWWPRTRTAGEADGDLKYAGEPGEVARSLRDRRRRDAELRRRGARAVAHWAWDEAVAADPLAAALVAAGLLPAHPADARQLHALRAVLTRPSRVR